MPFYQGGEKQKIKGEDLWGAINWSSIWYEMITQSSL